MAKDPSVFWGHGEGTRAAAAGGAGEEEATGKSSAESVTTVNRLEHFYSC